MKLFRANLKIKVADTSSRTPIFSDLRDSVFHAESHCIERINVNTASRKFTFRRHCSITIPSAVISVIAFTRISDLKFVRFNQYASQLTNHLGQLATRLADGLRVVAHGQISLPSPQGLSSNTLPICSVSFGDSAIAFSKASVKAAWILSHCLFVKGLFEVMQIEQYRRSVLSIKLVNAASIAVNRLKVSFARRTQNLVGDSIFFTRELLNLVGRTAHLPTHWSVMPVTAKLAAFKFLNSNLAADRNDFCSGDGVGGIHNLVVSLLAMTDCSKTTAMSN